MPHNLLQVSLVNVLYFHFNSVVRILYSLL